MAHLTLAGASDDGRRLRLVDEDGVEHVLEVTAAVRSAIGATSSRSGPMEAPMDSALRPRDIQARIRAGESPETVAQAARTTVDKIMVFARPVLAEREHVAQRAQGSSVRRASGEGGARTLGEAVETHLHALNLDPTLVDWDAWRREDGRWTLTATYQTAPREGLATFTFDPPGNYVLLEDDDARWLVGEVVASTAPAPSPDDDLSSRRRRLSSVPGEPEQAAAAAPAPYPADPDQLELGDDALEMVAESQPAESWLDDERPRREPVADEPELDLGVTPEPEPSADDGTRDQPAARDQDEAAEAADADERPVAPRRPAKKRGRASVPSWDEIMFGGGDQ